MGKGKGPVCEVICPQSKLIGSLLQRTSNWRPKSRVSVKPPTWRSLLGATSVAASKIRRTPLAGLAGAFPVACGGREAFLCFCKHHGCASFFEATHLGRCLKDCQTETNHHFLGFPYFDKTSQVQCDKSIPFAVLSFVVPFQCPCLHAISLASGEETTLKPATVSRC